MRDYIVLAVIIAGACTAVFRPFVGVLFWCWVSYMNPHRLTWGVAYNFPAALVVGGGTLLGLLFTKDRSKVPLERETYLLFALWILFVVTTSFSLYPAQAWVTFNQITKILLMTIVTMMLINTRQRLRTFLLVIALSVGFFGAKGGLFSLRGGGADRIYGPPGSFLEDNNDFALATVMILPILFYLARDEARGWFRHVLRATGVLSIVSVIFTYSRGGFVGLAAITSAALLKSKKKFLAAILVVIAASIAFFFVPDQWFNRMQTIGDSADASALGRINAWHFAFNLASHRLLGGGFGTFMPDIFFQYAPDPTDFHAAHSIYFEMLGEQGFLGLGLFLAILFSAIMSLHRLRREYSRWPEMRWVSDYADMIQIALIGYVTSGAFLGRSNFDLYYHLVAATVILKVLARDEAWRLTAPLPAEELENPEASAPPGELGLTDPAPV
jgi:probable O-glycosylation ligase (exosortase A-associated)